MKMYRKLNVSKSGQLKYRILTYDTKEANRLSIFITKVS